jgi:hypothetical protein
MVGHLAGLTRLYDSDICVEVFVLLLAAGAGCPTSTENERALRIAGRHLTKDEVCIARLAADYEESPHDNRQGTLDIVCGAASPEKFGRCSMCFRDER